MFKRLVMTLGLILMLTGIGSARDWNVLDAGARPDGQTDCTAAFQKALDEAGAAGGGVVSVPAGKYAIRGNLSIPAGVTLQGTYRVPATTHPHGMPSMRGTVLLAYAGRGAQTGPPFIRLAGNAAVLSGVIVTYPEWKQSDVPPVPYPPCVLAEGAEDTAVLDCLLVNPYEGIKLIRAARHFICRVFGYPSWRGLYVDECYDIGRIENIHFWPFGTAYSPRDPYSKWVNTHGVAFEFGRTDWHYVLNTFCFGYDVGYKFSGTKAGAANGNFVGIGADSTRLPVLVEQAQPMGLLITNGEFVGRWEGEDSTGVEIADGAKGKVSLVNCAFWGPLGRCIWAHGSAASQVTASACNFVEWDIAGNGLPAIQVDRGAAIVQGNTFGGHFLHAMIGKDVRSAILTANQAPGGFNIENAAGRRCQALANEESPVEWTGAARDHYRIQVGYEGDERMLVGWHGSEKRTAQADAVTTLGTMRWSGAGARLRLPVNPGKAYTIRVAVDVPGQALSDDAGIYLGSEGIIKFDHPGSQTVTGHLPQQQGTSVELAVKSKLWRPRDLMKGNRDPRELGITFHAIEMRAEGSPPRIFNANTGEWQ